MDVINSDGVIIHKQVISENEGQINLFDKVSAGIYFFRIIFKDSVITQSVIMQ
jgi:hypothetical protein